MPPESAAAAAAPATPAATPAAPATPAAAPGTISTPAASPSTPAQPAAAPAAAPATPATPAVPERYDLKLPTDTRLDAAALERTAAEARALGLSQEAAQKYLEAKHAEVGKYVETIQTQHATQVKQWETDVKADPELGGDKFARTAELSARFVDTFGSPTFKKMLSDTGYGNHPELVRIFAKAAAAIGEDQLAGGNKGGGAGPKDAATVLYGGGTT